MAVAATAATAAASSSARLASALAVGRFASALAPEDAAGLEAAAAGRVLADAAGGALVELVSRLGGLARRSPGGEMDSAPADDAAAFTAPTAGSAAAAVVVGGTMLFQLSHATDCVSDEEQPEAQVCAHEHVPLQRLDDLRHELQLEAQLGHRGAPGLVAGARGVRLRDGALVVHGRFFIGAQGSELACHAHGIEKLGVVHDGRQQQVINNNNNNMMVEVVEIAKRKGGKAILAGIHRSQPMNVSLSWLLFLLFLLFLLIGLDWIGWTFRSSES